ncbi:hypothetical protein AVEN_41455-1 [Araneus ventricosus]|uniref:Uncharacterized protein n=1 Tax=Araneus ventricosus TaxID=182803 RepID=A0A4Y2F295_ARAVE|nr:hypothetical protein AVEN_41455-1 [Araneus ventricosus]
MGDAYVVIFLTGYVRLHLLEMTSLSTRARLSCTLPSLDRRLLTPVDLKSEGFQVFPEMASNASDWKRVLLRKSLS